MMIKVFTQYKWTIISILILPILFSVISIVLSDKSAEELKIPVVLVDPFNQEITGNLLEDMSINDSFIVTKAKQIPKDHLMRGEVEAVFVLPQNLKEKISSGKLQNEITWYRHERSLFDGLFKEQLASSIVKRAVRAEAANIVKNYQENANWNKVYKFGLQYLETDPIFQIQFQTIDEQAQTQNVSSDKWVFMRWLYWLIIWGMIARLTQMLLNWREQLIFERLRTLGRSKSLHHNWLLFVALLLFFITLVTSTITQYIWLETYQELAIVTDLSLVLLSIVIYFLLSTFIKTKETLWMISFTYGVVSSIVFS
ncbi:ABC transporter permease [Piscibacillus salipiscarius]|uniref:ABC transporter permease n=1 Tax=Piscibacillus salipiscarius TaxID=299480 RepID=UPI0006D18AE1|nr:ABC transporter permease [Piscibacillus salipiscarius]